MPTHQEHVKVDAKQRDRKLFFCIILNDWAGSGVQCTLCLRFTAFLITPQICKAPQGGLQPSQRHGFQRKLSLEPEMSKTDFVQFLQQA